VSKPPGRVVLYRRVSALMGRGGEDFHSPELQTEAMRRHIGVLGLREVAEAEDIDVSGRTFNREGLDVVRSLVEGGQVDAVAVYDLSRLGRNAAEALTFVRWLADHKVSLISTREKIDDTPEGRLTLTLWFGMAELFSDQMGQRWKDVHVRVAQQGKHHGQTPIGYVRGKGGLEIDPIMAPAVAAAFRDYAAGKPVGDIAQDLSDARGKAVLRQRVKRMLSNRVYLGKVTLWGQNSKSKQWSITPLLVAEGRHEAIIDQDTFDLCMARCARDSTAPPRSLAASHAFSRAIKCGPCGGAAAAFASGSGEKRYRCRGRSSRSDCIGFGAPTYAKVEEIALAEISSYVARLRAPIAAKEAKLIRQRKSPDDPQQLDKELADVRAEMTRLAGGWAKKLIPDHSYEELLGECQRREEALVRRRNVALADRPKPVDVDQMASIGEELLANWGEMEPWERNEGVRLMGAVVTLWPASPERPKLADRVKVAFS